jgi:hypothetical protein
MNQLQVVPRLPEFEAYLARIADRPAYLRAQRLDIELMQSLGRLPATAAQ